jgi:hypothetical protein
MVAPGEAFHWKVIDVPDTVAALLGDTKAGATNAEGGIGVGEGAGSLPANEQANPEISNMHKSNTMVILGNFIFCLQIVPLISNRNTV